MAAPEPTPRFPLPLSIAVLAMAGAAVPLVFEAAGIGAAGLGWAQRLMLAGSLGALAVAGLLATPPGRRLAGHPAALTVTGVLDTAARLAGIAFQLWLLVLFMQAFRIESPAFYERLAPLILAGFVVHHLLPVRWRLSFFVLLCAAGLWRVFGPLAGGWLVGVGLVIIAACHLPIAFLARCLLVAAIGAVLALMRAGAVPAPWPAAIWPILGSMFMFRTILYLYDLRHARERPGLARTLAYFFMLPNVVFPLFPTVDFATFRRTWYDRPAWGIYQEGVQWIARGVIHLLVYRWVYQRLTLSPSDVDSIATLVQYMLANFGLYLRVSGQFHLIVGLLHLFGFRLPRTHRFFYLASSFTDFWRRINIYWKDFTQKVFFQPTYFPLRRRLGETPALVLATLAVFGATWVLHSYQWFWLLGTWLWSATDTAFWGILAVALVGNVLVESRRGRQRSLGSARPGWDVSLATGLRAALTFTVICSLWTLWTSPTFEALGRMVAAARPTPAGVLLLVSVLAGIAAAATLVHRLSLGWEEDTPRHPVWRTTLGAALPLAALAAATFPAVQQRLPLEVRTQVRDIRLAELNRRDAALLQRGYYENLVGVNRFNSQLWEVFSGKGREWPWLSQTSAVVRLPDLRNHELRPLHGLMYHGQPLRINQWGMRDREYPLEKPAGVTRVAVLGSSVVMGDGIGDGETFEERIEDRFAADQPLGPARRVEFLNFAVSEYSPYSQVVLLESGKIARFAPDVVILVAHDSDLRPDHVSRPVERHLRITHDVLRERIARAGLDSGMARDEANRRITPFVPELVAWAYAQVAARIREMGARPVWVYLPPEPPRSTDPDEKARLLGFAAAAGFAIVDLDGIWDDTDPASVVVAAWDRHPNMRGHAMIADRLYAVLLARPELLTRLRT